MIIRPFQKHDLCQAEGLAKNIWAELEPHIPVHERTPVYRLLVRYYTHFDSPFNFAAEENGQLCGFLLAFEPSAPSQDLLKELFQEFRDRDNAYLLRYKAYLDGNHHQEILMTSPGEVILGLFASSVRGAGRKLLKTFAEKALSLGKKGLILWTDETCDHSYYPAHGFQEIARMPANPSIDEMQLNTIFYKKAFDAVLKD